jgi:FkbM family methyltransferase
MLISVAAIERIWGIKPSGVLHVGAHEGEECAAYQKSSWGSTTWIEANPAKVEFLERQFNTLDNQFVIEAVAWGADGVSLDFHVANNGESSSVLDLGTHSQHHPQIHYVSTRRVSTTRLDTALQDNSSANFDFINLDVQGAELQALMGLGERINDVNWIYSEVNTEPVYEGAPLLKEFDAYCGQLGFQRIDLEMTRWGWGDALYCRTNRLPRNLKIRRRARQMLGTAISVRNTLNHWARTADDSISRRIKPTNPH